MKKKKLRKIALWLMILSIVSFPLIDLIALLKDFPTVVNILTILLSIAMNDGFFGAIVLFIVSLFVGNEKKVVFQNECGNDTKKENNPEQNYCTNGVISKNKIHIGTMTAKQCKRCNNVYHDGVRFAGKMYCKDCGEYYKSRFDIIEGDFIERNTGEKLLDEILLYKGEYQSHWTEAHVTELVINIFSDSIEILCIISRRNDLSGIYISEIKEILERDYFEKHNLRDYDEYMKAKLEIDAGLNLPRTYMYSNCDRFFELFKNEEFPNVEVKLYTRTAHINNRSDDFIVQSGIKKAKTVIEIFADKGYELSRIATIGGINEISHLGVGAYCAEYDNVASFINNAYPDYKKENVGEVEWYFTDFSATFARDGYTIDVLIGLNDEILIRRDKCSAEMKEIIYQVADLMKKEIYNGDCMGE